MMKNSLISKYINPALFTSYVGKDMMINKLTYLASLLTHLAGIPGSIMIGQMHELVYKIRLV